MDVVFDLFLDELLVLWILITTVVFSIHSMCCNYIHRHLVASYDVDVKWVCQTLIITACYYRRVLSLVGVVFDLFLDESFILWMWLITVVF